jgi:hypothetical protein
MLDILPSDIACLLASNYIDPISLLLAKRVNKTWYNIIGSDTVANGVFNKYVASQASGEIPVVKDKLPFVGKLIKLAKYILEKPKDLTFSPDRPMSGSDYRVLGTPQSIFHISENINDDYTTFNEVYIHEGTHKMHALLSPLKELDLAPDTLMHSMIVRWFRELRRIVHTCVRLLVGRELQDGYAVDITSLASPASKFPISPEYEQEYKLPHYTSWVHERAPMDVVAYFLYNKLEKDHKIPVALHNYWNSLEGIGAEVERMRTANEIRLVDHTYNIDRFDVFNYIAISDRARSAAVKSLESEGISALIGALLPWMGMIDPKLSIPMIPLYHNGGGQIGRFPMDSSRSLDSRVRRYIRCGMAFRVDGVDMELTEDGTVKFTVEQFTSLPWERLKQARYKLRDMVYACEDHWYPIWREAETKRRAERDRRNQQQQNPLPMWDPYARNDAIRNLLLVTPIVQAPGLTDAQRQALNTALGATLMPQNNTPIRTALGLQDNTTMEQ